MEVLVSLITFCWFQHFPGYSHLTIFFFIWKSESNLNYIILVRGEWSSLQCSVSNTGYIWLFIHPCGCLSVFVLSLKTADFTKVCLSVVYLLCTIALYPIPYTLFISWFRLPSFQRKTSLSIPRFIKDITYALVV